MLRPFIIIILIFLGSLLFSSNNKTAFIIIEANTPGILGAIFGGIIAGISVIFSVILSLVSSSNTNFRIQSFNGFIKELKIDIKILLFCLTASIFLPYFRAEGIPLISYPFNGLLPHRDVFFTALEITTIVISVSITLEILNIMLIIVSHYLDEKSTSDNNTESNE